MTEEEIQESSEFWAAVPWTRRMYVMEADLIPEMYLNPDNNVFHGGDGADRASCRAYC